MNVVTGEFDIQAIGGFAFCSSSKDLVLNTGHKNSDSSVILSLKDKLVLTTAQILKPKYFSASQDGKYFDWSPDGSTLVFVDSLNTITIWKPKALMTTGVKDRDHVQMGSGFTLYPDPVSERLFIQVDDGASVIKTSIVDLMGRVVWTEDRQESSIDVRSLPSGNYQLLLQFADGKISGKPLVVLH